MLSSMRLGERLSPSATVATVSLNLGIGLSLVALEVLIAH
jgi:hypothetical protein